MTIREIVDALQLTKIAPIHYHQGTIENIFMTKLYLCDKLPDLTQDKSCGIYLPDTDTVTACRWLYNYSEHTYFAIIQKNELKYIEQNKWDIISVFCILHEVGHWIDYKSKKTDNEKHGWIIGHNIKLRELQYDRKINQALFPQISLDFQEFADQCDYRDLPHEKIADEYARCHYLEAYNQIKI